MHQKDRTEDQCRTVPDEGPEPICDAGEEQEDAERENSDNYIPQSPFMEKLNPPPRIVTVQGKCTGQPELGNTHHNFRNEAQK